MRSVNIPEATNSILTEKMKENQSFYSLMQYMESQTEPISKQTILDRNFDKKRRVELYLRILLIGQYVDKTQDKKFFFNSITTVDVFVEYPIFTPKSAKLYSVLLKKGAISLTQLAKMTKTSYPQLCDEVELLYYFGVLDYINDGRAKLVFITDLGMKFKSFVERIFYYQFA